MEKIKAIFLDRDGTIIEDKHYLSDPHAVVLLPFVGETLKNLYDQGLQIFIVTNQSGIGRGYFPERDFHACQKELYNQLETFGVTIVDTAFCPHDPSNLHYSEFECVEMCACRKPNIGMWHQLEDKYHLKASECVMVGDKKEDLGFGINAGFAAVCLVPTGKGLASAKELGIELPKENRTNEECTNKKCTDKKNSRECDNNKLNISAPNTEIIEFSSAIVQTALPCDMQAPHVDNQDVAQTKCFALSNFTHLVHLLNSLS